MFIVDSLSSPSTNWDESDDPPGTVDVLLKAAGTPIDVSFPRLKDKAEREFQDQQPTSFVLTPEAVDRLRAAAGTIIMESPEFQRLMKDIGARILPAPAATAATAAPATAR